MSIQQAGTGDAGHPEEPVQAGSVLSLIRDLQSGRTSGANLSIEDRRRCVEHLSAEGYSVPEIAEILRANERTVARDRKAIREANALKVEPGFIEQTVGHLVRQAEQSVARLRRMSRDKDSPLSSRVEAERAAWDVGRELVQSLQSLGYLPTAARELKADLRHSVSVGAGEADDPDVLKELGRLQAVIDQATAAPDDRARMTAELGRLRASADKILLVERMQQLGAELRPVTIESEEVQP